MKVTLLFLGSTGAGPVYSFEMAKALAVSGKCRLQIVISKEISNLDVWKKQFQSTDVVLDIVDTYSHNKLSFALNTLNVFKINRIVKKIKSFKPDYLYVPFLLTWDFRIYPRVYKEMKIVSTLHDPHPHDRTSNPFVNWIQKKNMLVYKYVNDVIVLNKKDVDYVKENYCKNVHVIPHASFSYYNTSSTISQSNDEINKTIGFLGRIEPYKGLDVLVDAIENLNDVRLIIAGNGQIDKDTYQKIIENERVELINRYIKDEEFSDLLQRMDFVVLPYKRASQSGVIPLVFAHGKTVVVTNVGALSEQVPEGTGLIVEPEKAEVAKAISYLYDNKELITEYGHNAYLYSKNNLTWEHSVELLLEIFGL